MVPRGETLVLVKSIEVFDKSRRLKLLPVLQSGITSNRLGRQLLVTNLALCSPSWVPEMLAASGFGTFPKSAGFDVG